MHQHESLKCRDFFETGKLEPYQKDLLENKEPGFDLRTHIMDRKTGKLLRYQPYRRTVDRVDGEVYFRDGVRYNALGFRLDAIPASPEGKTSERNNKTLPR